MIPSVGAVNEIPILEMVLLVTARPVGGAMIVEYAREFEEAEVPNVLIATIVIE